MYYVSSIIYLSSLIYLSSNLTKHLLLLLSCFSRV